jgi:calcineurin-like phosphoesterase family protein/2'-5' RNA ligase
MSRYLIEYRFFGKEKLEIKKLIWEIDRIFNLRIGHRPIPHVSLAEISTREEERLISDFEELCDKQQIMTFKVKGYGTFDDTQVVFINIEPDENLDAFRWELSKRLREYCSLKPYDLERKFNFHATLAMNLHQDKLDAIKKYIQAKPELEFTHCVMRVTLIKKQKILREYDFLLKRLLSRREAKSRSILSESFARLEKYLEENKLIDTDLGAIPHEEALAENIGEYQGKIPIREPIEEVNAGDVKEGGFSKFLNRFRNKQVPRRIFFISDLHLDHANIIRYCNRPFDSVKQMNDTLVHNWNSTVGKNDAVYFLGDLAYGRGSRKTSYWLNKLNGNIIFVRGGHDRVRGINSYDRLILNHESQRFLLVHNPKDVPSNWQGWVIHGHTHNNKPEYPLVDKQNKTINVSVELLDYKPLSLNGLLELISS